MRSPGRRTCQDSCRGRQQKCIDASQGEKRFLLPNGGGKRTIRGARQKPGIRVRVDHSRSLERILKMCSASGHSHVRGRIASNRGDKRVATSNPAFSKDIFAGYDQVYGVPRSTVTTVQGTMAKTFLLLAIMSATALWSFFAVASDQLQLGVIPVAGIAGFILAMVTIFKPTVAPWTSPVYAAMEGVFLGAISQILSLFGVAVPFLFSSSPIGIGFSLFVVGLAAFNLLLDFDFIDQAAERQMPKYMEWYGAFGLMVTLVWLYLEMLRLLSKLANNRN